MFHQTLVAYWVVYLSYLPLWGSAVPLLVKAAKKCSEDRMALHRQRQYTKDGVSLQRRRNSDGGRMSGMITRRILTKHFHIAHQTVFLHSDHFLMNFFFLFTPVNPFLHSFDVFLTISNITASLCYSVILSDVTENDYQLDFLAQTLI